MSTPKTLAEMAEEYGLQVSKHWYERTPPTYITGEPRPWNKRPDSATQTAFLAGARAMVGHEAVKGMREALGLAMNAGLMGTGNIYFDAREALARFDALVKEVVP